MRESGGDVERERGKWASHSPLVRLAVEAQDYKAAQTDSLIGPEPGLNYENFIRIKNHKEKII